MWPESFSKIPPAAILLAACLAMGACSRQQAAGPPPRPPVQVSVAQARTRDVPVEVRAIGTVEAYSSVSIKSQESGQVQAVHFKEGQDVRKGDPLFTIDPRPFEVALLSAQAQLARDQAQLANAEAQERRYAKLLEEGVTSREQYDQVRTGMNALRAALRADDAAIERVKLDLSYCQIRSPIDGRTGRLVIHPGNVVEANKDPGLVVINQITPIYVNFSVPEQHLSEIKKRMAEGALRVVTNVPDGAPAEVGALAFVDNAVDATTGTIRLKATFANASRRLWPGQFVNAVLTLADLRGAVVVPSAAIQEGQSGTYVFVIRPDSTAEMRPVTPGRTVETLTVIEKGLAAGENVVTDGQIRLTNGVKVEFASSSPR